MRFTGAISGAARSAMLFVIVAMFVGEARAQAPFQPGAIEVSGAFGAAVNIPDINDELGTALNSVSSGFTVSGSSAFKWFVGGSAGYAVSPNLMVVFDTNYNHIGHANIGYGSVNISENSNLTDFTGGVHWQFPVSSSKFVPYLSAGLGGVRLGVSASAAGVSSISASETDFTFNAGGGLRIFIRPGWGVRPQFEVVRIPGQTYFRYGVGFFWQSKHN
jgi:opacity protein-like surface antigen